MTIYLLTMLTDLLCGLPFVWEWNQFRKEMFATLVVFTMIVEVVSLTLYIVNRKDKSDNQ